jgi:hypothetical protein
MVSLKLSLSTHILGLNLVAFHLDKSYRISDINIILNSYVHGLMDGEVFEDKELQTQEFHLI